MVVNAIEKNAFEGWSPPSIEEAEQPQGDSILYAGFYVIRKDEGIFDVLDLSVPFALAADLKNVFSINEKIPEVRDLKRMKTP